MQNPAPKLHVSDDCIQEAKERKAEKEQELSVPGSLKPSGFGSRMNVSRHSTKTDKPTAL